jgi:hypothetical protein
MLFFLSFLVLYLMNKNIVSTHVIYDLKYTAKKLLNIVSFSMVGKKNFSLSVKVSFTVNNT